MDPNRSRRDMAKHQQLGRGSSGQSISGNRFPANHSCGCSGAVSNDNNGDHSGSNHAGSRKSNVGSGRNFMEKIDQYPIAMAYVPWQKYGDTFDLETGFKIGTIFPELDKPFMRAGCSKR